MRAAPVLGRLARALCFHLFPEALRPYRASLLVTKRCNLKCMMCNFPDPAAFEGRSELATEEWKCILRRLSSFGVTDIGFQGGECLLRPDIDELVSYAKNELNSFTTLTSNGVLLGKKSECLAWVDRLIVSIDSSDPRVHDRIRGKEGLLHQVLANIEMVKHLPKKIVIATIIHGGNTSDMEQVVRYAQDNGFEINLFPLCRETVADSARLAEDMTLRLGPDPDAFYRDLKGVLRMPASIANYHRVRFILERDRRTLAGVPPAGLKARPCNTMNNFLIVMFDGTIYPCCGDMPAVGNLVTDDLECVWGSQKYRQYRNESRKGTTSLCRRCNHIETEYLVPDMVEELAARVSKACARFFRGGGRKSRLESHLS